MEELEKGLQTEAEPTAKARLHLQLGRVLAQKFLQNVKALKHFQDAYKLNPAEEDLKPAVVLEKPFHVAELLDLVGLFCGLGTPAAPVEVRTT